MTLDYKASQRFAFLPANKKASVDGCLWQSLIRILDRFVSQDQRL